MRILAILISFSLASLAASSIAAESSETPPFRGPKMVAVFAPRPVYPDSAKKHGIGGQGVFVMHVDVNTGVVRSVEIKQSTGVSLLDRCATDALRRWRFKTHIVAPKVVCPITFVPDSAPKR